MSLWAVKDGRLWVMTNYGMLLECSWAVEDEVRLRVTIVGSLHIGGCEFGEIFGISNGYLFLVNGVFSRTAVFKYSLPVNSESEEVQSQWYERDFKVYQDVGESYACACLDGDGMICLRDNNYSVRRIDAKTLERAATYKTPSFLDRTSKLQMVSDVTVMGHEKQGVRFMESCYSSAYETPVCHGVLIPATYEGAEDVAVLSSARTVTVWRLQRIATVAFIQQVFLRCKRVVKSNLFEPALLYCVLRYAGVEKNRNRKRKSDSLTSE